MSTAAQQDYRQHTISLYVANKPGVLIRVSLVFARRGYNIDSLVVSGAHDPKFSQMNIVASGDSKTLDQILKQLNKLVDVVHATDNTSQNVIQKELLLIKLDCPPDKRTEILQVASAFSGEIVDLSEATITFEVSGDSEKLDTVHNICSHYGVVEMVRSGKILMAKGENIT
ncbi:acetolactate synthase small subunit [Marispirochaeta sp.]|jgi:acetolactate synthase I/III small subunit|uniref:acetolactate synthase small subunit n=1 Tax=Marispirochaeta sp. TaxID=2038653 RepID=UPI0029C62D81|nr:acetolactate synthase small subunit [Marispirochaeta sp.]